MTGILLLGMPFWGEQEDIGKARQRLLKKIPIPANAIALEQINSFPAEEEGRFLLHNPCSLLMGSNSELYIVDRADNCIFICDNNGRFLRTLGRKGQGPGEFLSPGKVLAAQDSLIVLNQGNSRVDFFDLSGQFKRSFKIFKSYRDCAVHSGRIYLTSMGQRDEKLVDVLDFQGNRLFSFGDTRYDHYLLNWCRIAISSDGNIYLAFEHLPAIQRYTVDGRLLNEFRLKRPMSDIQEDINIRQARVKKPGPSAAAVITTSIVAVDNGVYVLHVYPRVEIFHFDPEGRPKRAFWYEYADAYFQDMLISRNQDAEHFYLLDIKSGTVLVLGLKIHK